MLAKNHPGAPRHPSKEGNLGLLLASEALSQQNRLSSPGEKPPARETFWARYYEHGLAEVLKYADSEFPE